MLNMINSEYKLEDNKINNEDDLKYLDAKNRINKLIEIEQHNIQELQQNLTNINRNYVVSFQDEICIIEIRNIIKNEENDKLFEELKNSNYNVAVYFTVNFVTSKQLTIFPILWKEIKRHNGNIFYLNKTKNNEIINILKMCALDRIMTIVDSFDEIKIKLKEIKYANV